MKRLLIAAALTIVSLNYAQAMDCYWDRAQRAQVCRPNYQERQRWRERHHYERDRPPGWEHSPYHNWDWR
jgi:hypothetical protein